MTWLNETMRRIEADYNRSADTHLIHHHVPGCDGIDLYFKDESTHPSGSLKHRLARSLFLYGVCNGVINEGTTIIESSSGSTAISEAYFARFLGLPFIAVVPKNTAKAKLDQIEFFGGKCHLVDPSDIYSDAKRLALELDGYYMDQFTNAERATDWRSNNNIADSIFAQMSAEKYPVPTWVVVSAGTGGTSATIGRYKRYYSRQFGATQLCVADPDNSVFYEYYHKGDESLTSPKGSRIEGIGRPRVEPSFIRTVVDHMEHVPDAASLAAIHFLEKEMGRKCGASTGTNFYATLKLMCEMKSRGEKGSVVTMICDPGERYNETYYNSDWLVAQGFDLQPHLEHIEQAYRTGQWGKG
ncbi:Cysteine synthase B [Candidatus Terasakiella magnetica]|uniref:L-cysteine desulfhydrase Cds1 n=1 Tax=Candidatus Terasakiella magnetica TaxID=1867952 RepID=A0A1C3RK91_9PROT|nr:PLP-dependent cysteine synthase family protein [Candidatus Terasakiella magnetica]SCA57740.1 Cysteine synthase B [Candidatus Terasakiella magnetica]